MENFNEFYHNENTTETQKGNESFTQSSTVILSPTEKEIPPIPPKNNRPPLRARVIVVLYAVYLADLFLPVLMRFINITSPATKISRQPP